MGGAQNEDDAECMKEDARKTTFSETVTEIETPKPVVTYLKEKAKKGDKKIQVDSVSGFKIGDTIIIGTSVFERKVISAFGSLEFDTPLEVGHEVGARVAVETAGTHVPRLKLDVESNSEEPDSGT